MESRESRAQMKSLSEQVVYVKQRRALEEFLYKVRLFMEKHAMQGKKCFITYAWENNCSDNCKKTLQRRLLRLSKDLRVLNVQTFLDIQDMQGDMNSWMKKCIDESDYYLVIGTPTYKRKTLEAKSNVAFELNLIYEKVALARSRGNNNILFPLLYEGTFDSSFPPEMKAHLIRDFRTFHSYFHSLTGMENPLGLIPDFFADFDWNGKHHLEYSSLYMNYKRKVRSEKLSCPIVQPVEPVNIDIETFLGYVMNGQQEQAEALLMTNSVYARMRGSITDLAGRKFENITGFQYALWALDCNMWRMIQKYLSQDEAWRQVQEPSLAYGECFSLKRLSDAYESLLKNWWKTINLERENHWNLSVGRMSREIPIHFFQEFRQLEKNLVEIPNFDSDEDYRLSRPLCRVAILKSEMSPYGSTREKRLIIECKPLEWEYLSLSTGECTGKPSVWLRGNKAKERLEMDLRVITALYNARLHQRELLLLELRNAELKVSGRSIETFLRCVVRSQLDQAEDMLKKEPKLALAHGNITDHSGRFFQDMTGFQYSFWALDTPMWGKIALYLPVGKDKTEIRDFLARWGDEPQVDWSGVNVAYSRLCSYNWNDQRETNKIWVEEIGAAQRLLPMHILNLYDFKRGIDELGKTFALLRVDEKKDPSTPCVTEIWGCGYSIPMQQDQDMLRQLYAQKSKEKTDYIKSFGIDVL